MKHFTVQTDAVTGEVTIIPFSDEEISRMETNALENAWENLRKQRNILLAESDWTQMPDASVDKSAWSNYRQELRDLPANTLDPKNPIWPLMPTP